MLSFPQKIPKPMAPASVASATEIDDTDKRQSFIDSEWRYGQEIGRVYSLDFESRMESIKPLSCKGYNAFPTRAEWTIFISDDGIICALIAEESTAISLRMGLYSQEELKMRIFTLPEVLSCFRYRWGRSEAFGTTEFCTAKACLLKIARSASWHIYYTLGPLRTPEWWLCYHYLHLHSRLETQNVVMDKPVGELAGVFFDHTTREIQALVDVNNSYEIQIVKFKGQEGTASAGFHFSKQEGWFDPSISLIRALRAA